MMDIKSAVQTMIKSMEETLDVCGLSVVRPQGAKKDDVPVEIKEDKAIVAFESDAGCIKVVLEDGKAHVLGTKETLQNANEENYTEIMLGLFEVDQEYFDVKDVKSLSNEIGESVEAFLGIKKKVTVGKDAKTAVKKGGKNSTVTYEPQNLAVRMANIYPELKPALAENLQTYDVFLEEDFFLNHANTYLLESIRQRDTQKVKKIFNAFNIFYEEGNADVQGLITVTILGTNLIDDEETLEFCKEYMDTELEKATVHVVHYLSGVAGKRAVRKLEDPKPYVQKKRKL